MPRIEGKTKIIESMNPETDHVRVRTKDAITAGNGEKHDIVPGKAELATRTTCNVFEYLVRHGIPVAYVERDEPDSFIARMANMIPVEVVFRSRARGSYLKRYPELEDGHGFEFPVVEYFYKTTGKKIGDIDLPEDDPLMSYNSDANIWSLYHPKVPTRIGLIASLENHFSDEKSRGLSEQLEDCRQLTLKVGDLLDNFWTSQGAEIQDFKLEFGVLDGKIVLADVVDCDSWRLLLGDLQLSKQGYRDGDDLDEVIRVYTIAADLTDKMSEFTTGIWPQ